MIVVNILSRLVNFFAIFMAGCNLQLQHLFIINKNVFSHNGSKKTVLALLTIWGFVVWKEQVIFLRLGWIVPCSHEVKFDVGFSKAWKLLKRARLHHEQNQLQKWQISDTYFPNVCSFNTLLRWFDINAKVEANTQGWSWIALNWA